MPEVGKAEVVGEEGEVSEEGEAGEEREVMAVIVEVDVDFADKFDEELDDDVASEDF